MGEGSSTPEEALPGPSKVKKPKLELDEYGQIVEKPVQPTTPPKPSK